VRKTAKKLLRAATTQKLAKRRVSRIERPSFFDVFFAREEERKASQKFGISFSLKKRCKN
jgi:hypothetical protein